MKSIFTIIISLFCVFNLYSQDYYSGKKIIRYGVKQYSVNMSDCYAIISNVDNAYFNSGSPKLKGKKPRNVKSYWSIMPTNEMINLFEQVFSLDEMKRFAYCKKTLDIRLAVNTTTGKVENVKFVFDIDEDRSLLSIPIWKLSQVLFQKVCLGKVLSTSKIFRI